MPNQNPEIQAEIFITRTPEQLWDFFMNQEGLKQWFDAKVFEIDVFEGGEHKFDIIRGGQTYRITGETGLLQEKKKLVFTWYEQNQWGQRWFTPTNITFEMLSVEGGTQFAIIHKGFKYLPEGTQEEICQQYQVYGSKMRFPA